MKCGSIHVAVGHGKAGRHVRQRTERLPDKRRIYDQFGAEGLKLMPELRELQDHELLDAVLDAIPGAASPEELRRLWTRKRRSKKTSRARSRSARPR